jgi:prepilin-type processing-associated H-X9-DG protein
LGTKITAPGELGAGSGRKPQGIHVALMPYIKSEDIFRCPNDPKFYGDKAGNKTVGTTALSIAAANRGKYTYYEALGSSYKFTKDNFSMPLEVNNGSANNNGLDKTDDRGDMSVRPASTSGAYSMPPMPMPMSYFARPSETRVIRDFNAPWEQFADTPNGFEEKDPREVATHKQGINIAYADGHVKFITSKAAFESLCDGPTLSPTRDGSCNTSGMERKTP